MSNYERRAIDSIVNAGKLAADIADACPDCGARSWKAVAENGSCAEMYGEWFPPHDECADCGHQRVSGEYLDGKRLITRAEWLEMLAEQRGE